MPESDQQHLVAMRAIVAELDGTPYVLKGGGALVLVRGMHRVTTDLDFDSTKSLNLRHRIEKAFRNAGITNANCDSLKDTETTQRYRVNYTDDKGRPQSLKIETKFHDTIDVSQVEIVDGVTTYKVEVQMAQKLAAAASRGGLAPRDIYDIAFLAKEHPSSLHGGNLKNFLEFSSDINKLDQIYRDAWFMDHTLVDHCFDATVLTLSEIAQSIKVPNPEHTTGQIKAVYLAANKGLLVKDEAAQLAVNICGVSKDDPKSYAEALGIASRCILCGSSSLIDELLSRKAQVRDIGID